MLLGKGHKNVFKKINKILCSLRNGEKKWAVDRRKRYLVKKVNIRHYKVQQ